jgi:N-acetylglucosaminyldiphosphoundecaprenol N-acetyl-beta-D-mannosaminyltransferase
VRALEVDLGFTRVADHPRSELVADFAKAARDADVPLLAHGLHVGGLLHTSDAAFMRALERADWVYADGMAIVTIARAAGATRIDRSPTTEIGVDVMVQARALLGRAPRVALIGGPEGLAARAAAVLTSRGLAEVVYTSSGYFDDTDRVLQQLRRSRPQLVFIGLGLPLEACWASLHREAMPPALVITCGGFFGFLTGDEQRAPAVLRKLNLEWVWRLRLAPRRLARRYFLGGILTLRHVLVLKLRSWRGRRARAR